MKKRRQRARLEVVDEGDACEMSARMLTQATSLRRAAEILDQAHDESAEGRNQEDFSAAFHGAPILRAQSAEIALKALWRIGHNEERGEPPPDHDLTKLHDALTETIQKRLAEEFPEIRDPSYPHSPMPVRKGLRTILNEHETALVDWRYGFLTFANGGLHHLVCPSGWDSAGRQVWARWSSPGEGRRKSPCWFDGKNAEPLAELFSDFMDRWTAEGWEDALGTAIWWYAQANSGSPMVDQGIVSAQIAVERLSYEYCVRERALVSKQGFDQLWTSDRYM